jgi:hypothetical protein
MTPCRALPTEPIADDTEDGDDNKPDRPYEDAVWIDPREDPLDDASELHALPSARLERRVSREFVSIA